MLLRSLFCKEQLASPLLRVRKLTHWLKMSGHNKTYPLLALFTGILFTIFPRTSNSQSKYELGFYYKPLKSFSSMSVSGPDYQFDPNRLFVSRHGGFMTKGTALGANLTYSLPIDNTEINKNNPNENNHNHYNSPPKKTVNKKSGSENKNKFGIGFYLVPLMAITPYKLPKRHTKSVVIIILFPGLVSILMSA